MFSNRVEDQILEAVNTTLGLALVRNDVHKMHFVPDVSKGHGMSVLCLQYGKLTILVSVKISDDGQKLLIEGIKTVSW